MVSFELIGLAFTSGAILFLNPCSFALLPAFVSYFLGKEENSDIESKFKEVVKGVKFGLSATLGFATVFLSMGFLVSWIGPQIRSFLPPVLLIVGVVLLVLGLLWAFDVRAISSFYGISVGLPRSSFYLFGVAYALSSLTCVFPIFLMLISSTLSSGGFFSAISVFISFTLGMGSLMIIISVSVALSKSFIIEKFASAKKYITRASGIVLILAGIYLIYDWAITYFF